MKAVKVTYTLAFLFVVLLFSCRDNTVKPPELYLDYPQEGSAFNAGDTLVFKVRVVSDDEEIKNLLVYLSDGNEQIFSPVQSYQVNLHATTIVSQLIIPSNLGSGTYFLTFKAETNEDTYKYFFRISIHELPLKTDAFAGAYGNTLYIFNDSLQFSAQMNFADSILDIKPLSGGRAVYVLTAGGFLYKYNYAEDNLLIIDQNLNNSMNDFLGKMFFRVKNGIPELFYPRATGFVKMVNTTQIQSQEFLSSYQRPIAIYASDNYVYVATRSVVGSQKAMLYMFYNSNLSIYKTFALDYLFVPTSIVPESSDLIRVYGNKADTAMFFDIYTAENTSYQYFLENTGELFFAYTLSADADLIATENGLLGLTDNGYHTIDNSIYKSFADDSLLSGKYYLVDGSSSVTSFLPKQEVVVSQKDVGVQIDKLCLIYNK